MAYLLLGSFLLSGSLSFSGLGGFGLLSSGIITLGCFRFWCGCSLFLGGSLSLGYK
jgi:hypothetical protein